MRSVEFPTTGEKINLIWQQECQYYALIDRGEFIKIYRWDGVSTTWNEVAAYEKFNFKD